MPEALTFDQAIEETLAHYATHPRAQRDSADAAGICAYYLPSNKAMCAVGRMLREENIATATNVVGGVRTLMAYLDEQVSYLNYETNDLDNTRIEKFLQPQYAALTMQELTALQYLHDRAYHWETPFSQTGSKLSAIGVQFIAKVLERRAEGKSISIDRQEYDTAFAERMRENHRLDPRY